jgi:glycosidase
MLHLYRRLLALRHDEPALRIGSFERLEVADGLLAFTRSLDGRSWLVMVNFTDRDVDVTGTVGRPAAITAFADATVVLASDGRGEHRAFDGLVRADQAVVLCR